MSGGPELYQNMLGADYRIIEDAPNCSHQYGGGSLFPHRLGLASLETALDAHAPLDLVIIQMGVNELKHMFNLTAGMISFGVEKLVACGSDFLLQLPSAQSAAHCPRPGPGKHRRHDFRLQLWAAGL